MSRFLLTVLALVTAVGCGGSLDTEVPRDGAPVGDGSGDAGPEADTDRACAEVECASGQECVDGACVAVSLCDDVECPDPSSVCDPRTGACVSGARDLDGDGFSIRDGDCDDGDDQVYPGAEETCDDVDQDCDGETDEGLAVDGGWSSWSDWSSCTASCDGGSESRSRSCTAPEPFCGGATCSGDATETRSCNTHPCCSTDHTAMEALRRCAGTTSDIIAWDPSHFGLDDGSVENRRQCAEQCTAWARGSHTSWCCDLSEDRTTGTSWACAAHTGLTMGGYSDPDSRGSYAVIGGCD